MYKDGHGVPKDLAEAIKWYRKAAEAGNDDAMRAIGWRYEHGEGLPQDYAEARKWMQRAADAGNEDAKKWLKEHPNSRQLIVAPET